MGLSGRACMRVSCVYERSVRNNVRLEDAQLHIMLKAALYKTVIRPVLMFGSETCALRKAEQNLLERIELRMLRWMMGVKRIEKIRNEETRARGMANMREKIRGARLRWLGHIWRKD